MYSSCGSDILISQLKATHAKHQDAEAALLKQLDERQHSLDELRLVVKQTQGELQAAQRRAASAEQSLSQSEAARGDLTSRLSSAESELQKLRELSSSSAHRAVDLETAKSQHEQVIARLNARVGRLEEQVKELEATLEATRTELADTRQTADAVKLQKEAAEASVAKLQARANELQSTVAAERNLLGAANKSLQNAEVALAEARQEVARLDSALQASLGREKALQAKLHELEAELQRRAAAAQAEAAKAAALLDRERSARAADAQRATELSKSHHEQLQQLQGRLAAAEKRVEDEHAARVAAETQCEQVCLRRLLTSCFFLLHLCHLPGLPLNSFATPSLVARSNASAKSFSALVTRQHRMPRRWKTVVLPFSRKSCSSSR